LVQEACFGKGDSARHWHTGEWQSACVTERFDEAANPSEGYEVDVIVEDPRLSRAQFGEIGFRGGFDERDVVGYIFEIGPVDSLILSDWS
jgi:hypothetical protein